MTITNSELGFALASTIALVMAAPALAKGGASHGSGISNLGKAVLHKNSEGSNHGHGHGGGHNHGRGNGHSQHGNGHGYGHDDDDGESPS